MKRFTDGAAYLSWRMRSYDRPANYVNMAEGYEIAAGRLADSLIESNAGHEADVVAFPVLFCAHQSIELYLKAVDLLVRHCNGENVWDAKVMDGHDIKRILDSLNSLLPAQEKIVRNSSTEPLFDFIDLCMEIGDDGEGGYHADFARYPERLSKGSDKPRESYAFVKEPAEKSYGLRGLSQLVKDSCSFASGLCSMWLDREESVCSSACE